jgi:hypothetical protein
LVKIANKPDDIAIARVLADSVASPTANTL